MHEFGKIKDFVS